MALTSTASLSILIPTIGRATLARALASCVSAGLGGEGEGEVLCVADGPCQEARAIWEQAKVPGFYLETPYRAGDWGHTPRNMAMALARGQWVLSIDDDDRYLGESLAAVRTILGQGPWRPHLFRMYRPPEHHGVLWREQKVHLGYVSTQIVAAPNDGARLGHWGRRHAGDFDFIASTLAHYPEGPVWREEIIVEWNAP